MSEFQFDSSCAYPTRTRLELGLRTRDLLFAAADRGNNAIIFALFPSEMRLISRGGELRGTLIVRRRAAAYRYYISININYRTSEANALEITRGLSDVMVK